MNHKCKFTLNVVAVIVCISMYCQGANADGSLTVGIDVIKKPAERLLISEIAQWDLKAYAIDPVAPKKELTSTSVEWLWTNDVPNEGGFSPNNTSSSPTLKFVGEGYRKYAITVTVTGTYKYTDNKKKIVTKYVGSKSILLNVEFTDLTVSFSPANIRVAYGGIRPIVETVRREGRMTKSDTVVNSLSGDKVDVKEPENWQALVVSSDTKFDLSLQGKTEVKHYMIIISALNSRTH